MGWAIAGGVLGIILMFGAYRWIVGWSTARAGGVYIPTIGSRPRRLAGVPEEAPIDAKAPPAMEVLRHGQAPVFVAPRDVEQTMAVEGGVAGESVVFTATDYPVEEALKDDGESGAAIGLIVDGADAGVVVAAVSHGSKDTGEHVVIANNGPHPVGLEGWRLTDDGEVHVYEFPSIILEPQTEVRVHMWRGEDTATDLYVGRRNRWWNDTGDTAYLYDAAGVLVHELPTANE